MTTSETWAQIRELSRELKRLRQKLRGSPAQSLKPDTRPKREKRQTIAEIRDEVFKRAGGRCEAYRDHGRCWLEPKVLDHWLSGSGRRQQKQSVQTCWGLCESCNDNRTANFPSAEWWNKSFELHCQAHGYPFTPHITRGIEEKGRTT